jgi:hypothetical protein
MNLITWAILILAVFIAIWVFVVVPAEKRHHERKLESLRSRIEKRQGRTDDDTRYGAPTEEKNRPPDGD